MSARLRPVTVHAGLSPGDRACLALGRALGRRVLTADAAWLGSSRTWTSR
jgi:PIN domain nuclease of toxin-antitoxin system